MGIPVLILGESGAGKTSSLRNYSPGEVMIFNVAGKPFPFRKRLDKLDTPGYQQIKQTLSRQQYKKYVIDDSQYLLAFEMFDRAKDTGYGKFTDMAIHFKGLIDYVIRNTPEDTIVYFMHHTETQEGGKVKAKTVGKMLDNQLTLEGLFSIVLLATVEGSQHVFVTQSDGSSTCKSPMDMFQYRIDNDLNFVDQTIREYWDIQETDPGEQAIDRKEWIRISKAAGDISDIATAAYLPYGYEKPSEIKRKDLEEIIQDAAAMYEDYKKQAQEFEQEKGDVDDGKNTYDSERGR